MTIPYYDDNGEAFFKRTVNIDLAHLYDVLADLIPKEAHILDAGCGSGRDSNAFLERGYQVSAFDASATLVDLARAYTGLAVQHHTFAEMRYDSQFDAIWANASLLHLPYHALPQAFENIAQALKKNGIFYCSFKEGTGEGIVEDGRYFTYFTETLFREFIAEIPSLSLEKIRITADDRPNTRNWLNVYMRYEDA